MKKTFTKFNYNFIAVPTNLFYVLDCNLRNCLIVLLQLSNLFADADGFFSVSNHDLQNYFRLGKNLTSVCLQTLYVNNIIQTKVITTKSKKNLIMYRVNIEKLEEYNKLNFKTIVDNDDFQINTLDYGKGSNFKVTYTASTENNNTNDEAITEPTSVQNDTNEEIPTSDVENAPTALETSNPANVEEYTLSEVDEDEVLSTFFYDEVDDCPLTDDELKEHERYIKEKELELAETPTEQIKVDGEVVETASAIPTDLNRVEKRSIYTNEKTEKLDESVKQKCVELVQRYVEMVIPNSNESLEKCNQALKYIIDKYNQGYIDIMDKDRLCRELISARFMKHSI